MPHRVLRGRGAAALCAAIALLATTLGAHAAGAGHRGAAGPVDGGILRIAYSGTMSTFDPAQAFYEDWYVMMGSLYDGLYMIDRNGRPQLDLAAAPPQVSADRKTWTFALHRDVRFHNGLEVTASDVKYSIIRTLDPHLKPAVSWGQPADNIFAGSQDFISGKARGVKGIQVVDRYTIRFVLTQPVAVFPYILAASYNVVIPQAVVSRESPDAVASHPIGTGPYMLQSWQKGVKAVFVRNPHYFLSGKPHINTIVAYSNMAANLIALKVEKGELDGFGLASEVAPPDLQQARGDPRYARYLLDTPISWISWLDLNVHVAPFNSQALRQAVALAIDRQHLIKLLTGQAYPAHQLFYPVDPQYDPQLEQHPVYGYDVKKARALVKASGYHGQPITLYYPTDYAFQVSIAPGVQQALQQIGLNVTLRGATATSLRAIQSSLNSQQISFNEWSPDYPDAYDFYQGMMGCGVSAAGGESGAHDCIPAADALVARAEARPLGAGRDALLQQAEVLALQRASRIPLVFPKFTTMVSPRVGGYYYHPLFGWQFENYWLQP